jgi:hypothetical protein
MTLMTSLTARPDAATLWREVVVTVAPAVIET